MSNQSGIQKYFLHPLEEADINGFAVSKRNVVKMKKFDTSIHFHDYFEIELVFDGTATHYLNGTSIPVRKGYITLLTPKDFHSFHIEENVILRLYNIAFTASHISSEIATRILECPYALQGMLDEETSSSLFEICELMYRERKRPTSDFPLIRRSLLDSILSILIERFGRESPINLHRSKTINEVLLNIEKAYTDPTISLSQIADRMNRTQNYLGKLVREYTGQSFNRYINQKRMNHSLGLLKIPSIPIAKVASECGFSSTSYFIKLFKEEYGLTPNEYRETLKANET